MSGSAARVAAERGTKMKRLVWIWATLAVMGIMLVAVSVPAEEGPSAPHAATAPHKAKVGEEVACAIDGMKMPLQVDTPSAEYHGKVYYFCTDAEKQQFLKNPERYANR
jgi:YHS domain-containing protein